jgi:hypothetical protein
MTVSITQRSTSHYCKILFYDYSWFNFYLFTLQHQHINVDLLNQPRVQAANAQLVSLLRYLQLLDVENSIMR